MIIMNIRITQNKEFPFPKKKKNISNLRQPIQTLEHSIQSTVGKEARQTDPRNIHQRGRIPERVKGVVKICMAEFNIEEQTMIPVNWQTLSSPSSPQFLFSIVLFILPAENFFSAYDRLIPLFHR